jgi:predicted phage baseplate assembly protein
VTLSPPTLESRTELDFVQELGARLPGMVPGWRAPAGGFGAALTHLYGRYLEALAGVVNGLPSKLELAFLDLLGASPTPAQPARAPVAFRPLTSSASATAAETPVALVVPAASRLAAQQSGGGDPIIFETEQDIAMTDARLTALVATWPAQDQGQRLLAGDGSDIAGDLFESPAPIEHCLYIGDDRLAIAGAATIIFTYEFARPAGDRLELGYELWDGTAWRPLDVIRDTTSGFSRAGVVELRTAAWNAATTSILGNETYWVRLVLKTQLNPGHGALPQIADIKLATEVRLPADGNDTPGVAAGVKPGNVAVNGRIVDATTTIFPFGPTAQVGSVFAVQTNPQLTMPGASITIAWTPAVQPLGSADGALLQPPVLSWEYWGGTDWNRVPAASVDFRQAAEVTLSVPDGLAATTFAGQDGKWLRVRLVAGGYVVQQQIPMPPTGGLFGQPVPDLMIGRVVAPALASVTLRYDYRSESARPHACITANAFVEQDVAAALAESDQHVTPFVALAESTPTVSFGFDRPLPDGTLSMYVDATADQGLGHMIWEAWSDGEWTRLRAQDETAGLKQPGMVVLSGAGEATPRSLSGQDPLRWLRARAPGPVSPAAIHLAGVHINAAWADALQTTQDEVLGSATGAARQSVQFAHRPVQGGEVVEVRELSGPIDNPQPNVLTDRLRALRIDENDARIVTDPASGAVMEVWVRWHAQPSLLHSGPNDRHYVIDRSVGVLSFGDGVRGMAPQPGTGNITARTYRSGGGSDGNVPAGAIKQLLTPLAGVAAVANPVPASGGADAEPPDRGARRAPGAIATGRQAVTPADYEALALDASAEVAMARAIPAHDPTGRSVPGWVTLIIVAADKSMRPTPSPGLCQMVHDHLGARVPAGVADRIFVRGPRFVEVGVIGQLSAVTAANVNTVLQQVHDALLSYLNPAYGGPSGSGWSFGSSVMLADVSAFLQALPGVDHMTMLALLLPGGQRTDTVTCAQDQLVTAGAIDLVALQER